MNKNKKPLNEIKIINHSILDSTHLVLEDCRMVTLDHFTPCGPMSTSFAEVKMTDTRNNETYYLTLAEVMGFPHYYLTGESIYDQLVEDDEKEYVEENDELTAFLNSAYIKIGDYSELTDRKWKAKSDSFIIAYFLTRIDEEELKEFLNTNKGKLLKDIEVDTSILDLDEDE